MDLRVQVRTDVNRTKAQRETQSRLAQDQAQVAEESQRKMSSQVQDAMRHPYAWATGYTETYDEQWVENGRDSPYGPFPKHDYFQPLFDIFLRERIIFVEKSRTMMLSWACVAYFTWEVQRTPMCGALFQCQKRDKVKQLIDYAKCLWDRQPGWLKETYPLARPLHRQSAFELEYAHGGSIIGVSGGADQVRSYHPWGYLLDEASFVVEAGESYNEALAACKGKVILNSSAGPGWFADVRRDIIRAGED